MDDPIKFPSSRQKVEKDRGNPWVEFSWIKDNTEVVPRQFSSSELLSILDYFETKFTKVTVASLAVKVFVWSYARRKDFSGLKWSSLRLIEGEAHFDIVGKWRVRMWFRIPARLYEALDANRVKGNDYVFAAYSKQLRRQYEDNLYSKRAKLIRPDFQPTNFGEWIYEHILDWSESHAADPACVHSFRKTGLQHAVDGEFTNKTVASDARLNMRVMTGHYTTEQDRQLREKSNRTFERIAKSLPDDVLSRYGYDPQAANVLQTQLLEAVSKQDWLKVMEITQKLSQITQPG